MAGQSTQELTIFTEDRAAEQIVRSFLPLESRERIEIFPIGSAEAVLRQIAARYREHKLNCIAFMDGDKRNERESHIEKVRNYLETHVGEDFESWICSIVHYLPGETWPERYIIEKADCEEAINNLVDKWDATSERVHELLVAGKAAAKHSEIYTIAQRINQSQDLVWAEIIHAVKKASPEDAQVVTGPIGQALAVIT